MYKLDLEVARSEPNWFTLRLGLLLLKAAFNVLAEIIGHYIKDEKLHKKLFLNIFPSSETINFFPSFFSSLFYNSSSKTLTFTLFWPDIFYVSSVFILCEAAAIVKQFKPLKNGLKLIQQI